MIKQQFSASNDLHLGHNLNDYILIIEETHSLPNFKRPCRFVCALEREGRVFKQAPSGRSLISEGFAAHEAFGDQTLIF